MDSRYWEQEDDFRSAIPILVGKAVVLISSFKFKHFFNKANSTPHNFMSSIVIGTHIEAYLKSVERAENFSIAYSNVSVSVDTLDVWFKEAARVAVS